MVETEEGEADNGHNDKQNSAAEQRSYTLTSSHSSWCVCVHSKSTS